MHELLLDRHSLGPQLAPLKPRTSSCCERRPSLCGGPLLRANRPPKKFSGRVGCLLGRCISCFTPLRSLAGEPLRDQSVSISLTNHLNSFPTLDCAQAQMTTFLQNAWSIWVVGSRFFVTAEGNLRIDLHKLVNGKGFGVRRKRTLKVFAFLLGHFGRDSVNPWAHFFRLSIGLLWNLKKLAHQVYAGLFSKNFATFMLVCFLDKCLESR
mmetsp:Transcript_6024/g.11297  ORF Transcript_6024/g.11297 Transcript_6024/m.11297 type:complete len:210 (+) Transcript_6024:2351-2980(+)